MSQWPAQHFQPGKMHGQSDESVPVCNLPVGHGMPVWRSTRQLLVCRLRRLSRRLQMSASSASTGKCHTTLAHASVQCCCATQDRNICISYKHERWNQLHTLPTFPVSNVRHHNRINPVHQSMEIILNFHFISPHCILFHACNNLLAGCTDRQSGRLVLP